MAFEPYTVKIAEAEATIKLIWENVPHLSAVKKATILGIPLWKENGGYRFDDAEKDDKKKTPTQQGVAGITQLADDSRKKAVILRALQEASEKDCTDVYFRFEEKTGVMQLAWAFNRDELSTAWDQSRNSSGPKAKVNKSDGDILGSVGHYVYQRDGKVNSGMLYDPTEFKAALDAQVMLVTMTNNKLEVFIDGGVPEENVPCEVRELHPQSSASDPRGKWNDSSGHPDEHSSLSIMESSIWSKEDEHKTTGHEGTASPGLTKTGSEGSSHRSGAAKKLEQLAKKFTRKNRGVGHDGH